MPGVIAAGGYTCGLSEALATTVEVFVAAEVAELLLVIVVVVDVIVGTAGAAVDSFALSGFGAAGTDPVVTAMELEGDGWDCDWG